LPKSISVRLRGLFTKHPEAGAGLATLVMFVVFSLWAENFLSVYSLNTMLFMLAEWGIIALGFTLLMIGGEFDLSVGSVLALCGVLAIFMMNAGLPAPIAVVMTLIIGVAIGLLHGLAVVKLGVPSFIVTLAAMMFWRGVVMVITGAFPVSPDHKSAFFEMFSYRFENGFNISVLWFLGVAVMLALILHRTRFGNWIFATGGNKLAAIQSGVPVNRVKLILFGLTSGLASLAGIIQMARYGALDPLQGEFLELRAIAAIVTGGTLLMGGYGSILGTVFGVILIGIIKNGLTLTDFPSLLFEAMLGVLIVIAVIINSTVQRRALGVRGE
jgi:simple sugar transport system permease protein